MTETVDDLGGARLFHEASRWEDACERYARADGVSKAITAQITHA